MAAYHRANDLTVTCRLTACTPASAPGPTLDVEYGKPLPFFSVVVIKVEFSQVHKTSLVTQKIKVAFVVIVVVVVAASAIVNDNKTARFVIRKVSVHHWFSSVLQFLFYMFTTAVLRTFCGHYTGESALAVTPHLRTARFCQSKLLLPMCVCWWHVAHLLDFFSAVLSALSPSFCLYIS